MNTKQLPAEASDSLARLRQCLPAQWRNFPANRSLVELGLDSLDTVEFLCTVHVEFGIRLREEDFCPGQSLEGLHAAIVQRREQS